MAFTPRGSSGRTMAEASYNNIVRRMVSLPRNILGGVSRVVDQGIDLMRIGGRRNQHHHLPQTNYPFQHPHDQLMINVQDDQWAFLASFEQHYDTAHPFFYACKFMEALKMAQDEHKFVFMYLHSPDHPFTPSFCRETLCSEPVVQFLDTNFVCWGAIANREEGLHMAATLRPATFPFCAIVAPASGDSLAILQQVEGPVSPAELVEILQRVMEEQGMAFGSGRAKEEEKRRDIDRRLREEQDVAYLAALQIDQENDKLTKLPSKERSQKQVEASNRLNNVQIPVKKQAIDKAKEANITRKECDQPKDHAISMGQATTQIMVRFPNGERKEKSFLCTEKIEAIYRYIDSLGGNGMAAASGGGVLSNGESNYKLVSSFPKKVYGVDEMEMTLKDAGLHPPRATLFLELLN